MNYMYMFIFLNLYIFIVTACLFVALFVSHHNIVVVCYIMGRIGKGSGPWRQELNSLRTTASIKAPQFPRLHFSFCVRHIAFTLTRWLNRLLYPQLKM